MGVTTQQSEGVRGAEIVDIAAGSGAADSSLRVGDVVTAVDDADVTALESMRRKFNDDPEAGEGRLDLGRIEGPFRALLRIADLPGGAPDQQQWPVPGESSSRSGGWTAAAGAGSAVDEARRRRVRQRRSRGRRAPPPSRVQCARNAPKALRSGGAGRWSI